MYIVVWVSVRRRYKWAVGAAPSEHDLQKWAFDDAAVTKASAQKASHDFFFPNSASTSFACLVSLVAKNARSCSFTLRVLERVRVW